MNVDRATHLLNLAIGHRLEAAGLTEDQAVCLAFADASAVRFEAQPDTDEIVISADKGAQPPADPRLAHSVGAQLYAWWWLTNDAGLRGGVLLAFGPNRGVLLTVMASAIHVLRVEGEQLA